MPTPLDLSTVSRRDIRYVLICLQNKTEIVKPEHAALVEPLLDFLKSNGRTIETFTVEWDLGIDEWQTMFMRPESWFCWGIPRTVVVDKPRGIPLSAGLAKIVAAGFGRTKIGDQQLSPDDHKHMFSRADYDAILAGAAERKGW